MPRNLNEIVRSWIRLLVAGMVEIDEQFSAIVRDSIKKEQSIEA